MIDAVNAKPDLLWMHEYIEKNCIFRSSNGDVLLTKNGTPYSWLFDFRPLALDAAMLRCYADCFWDAMTDKLPFQLASIEVAGIPLMAAVLHEAGVRCLDVSGLIVRDKRKKYGRQRLVEGKPVFGLPVVLIDDSCNAAKALNKANSCLQEEGLQVSEVFVLVDFASTYGTNWLYKNKIKMHSLFELADFNLSISNTHNPIDSYELLWTFASPKPNYQFAVAKSTPVLYKNSIIFGSDAGTLWSLNTITGRINWSVQTEDTTGKGIISSPALHEGLVYFGAYDGILYCVNAATGEVVHRKKVCSWIGSSPLIINDKLYIGLEFPKSPMGRFSCFDLATLTLQWSHDTKIMLHGSAVYSAKHEAIFIGTNDGTVLMFCEKSGLLLRTLNVDGAIKYHCAVEGDLCVFGSFDGNIYVWDFIRDEVVFKHKTDDIVYSRPLIYNNRAFMGSADGQFVVINLLTMTLEAAFDCGEKVHSSPALVNGLIYFGTSAGELIGLDPINYKTMVRLQFPERLTNTLIEKDGLLYVYAYDNKMWAIKPANE